MRWEWNVEGIFLHFQWKSHEVHRNMCSETGQFLVFCSVTGVDSLRKCPRKIGRFCPPIKDKTILWCFSFQHSTIPWTCVLHRKSILRRVYHQTVGQSTTWWADLLFLSAVAQRHGRNADHCLCSSFSALELAFGLLLFIHVSILHCFVIFKQYINLLFQNDHTSV